MAVYLVDRVVASLAALFSDFRFTLRGWRFMTYSFTLPLWFSPNRLLLCSKLDRLYEVGHLPDMVVHVRSADEKQAKP
jgi:hypothetical protein